MLVVDDVSVVMNDSFTGKELTEDQPSQEAIQFEAPEPLEDAILTAEFCVEARRIVKPETQVPERFFVLGIQSLQTIEKHDVEIVFIAKLPIPIACKLQWSRSLEKARVPVTPGGDDIPDHGLRTTQRCM